MLLTAVVSSPVIMQTVLENSPTTIDLATHITDPAFPDTIVEFTTNEGVFDVEVFDHDTPATVANFLQYVNSGLYNRTIIHRVVNDTTTPFQVVQGGGFGPDGTPIQTFAPVTNELHFLNTRGTIALAKPGNDPNGGTSQFFFNISDNPFLDNPSAQNDGGYTVFGRVVAGLPVLDHIVGLPTVDGTSLNQQFGSELPISSTPASGTGLSASNLVNVENVSVIPAVSFTAVSDNLELVNPTITNGTQLSFNPAPGRSGFCHVTVTGQDLLGNLVQDKILVEVAPSARRSLDVTLGAGHSHSVTYKQTDGTRGTITLSGKGSAIVHFAGDSLKAGIGGQHVTGDNLQVMGIDAAGTTSSSALTVRGGGNRFGIVTVGPVTTNGAFGTLLMRRTLVEGNITAPAGIGSVKIDYLNGGTITSSTPIKPGRLLSLKGIAWTDVSVNSAAPISTIKTTSWANSDSVSESLQAPYVRDIRSKGAFTPGLQLSGIGAPHGRPVGNLSIKGYIGGVWNFPGGLSSLDVGGTETDFNGTFVTPLRTFNVKGNFGGSLTAPSVGALIVRGSMTRATLTFTNPVAAGQKDLGKLSVRGIITQSLIKSTGNIGAVSAEAFVSSELYAGVGTIASGGLLPLVRTDFSASAAIASVSFHPRRTVTGFANSVIAAEVLGTLSLASVNTGNAGNIFGVTGASLSRLTGHYSPKKPVAFSFKDVTTQAQVAAVIAANKLILSSFTITIVP